MSSELRTLFVDSTEAQRQNDGSFRIILREQMEVAISELRRVLVPQGRLVSCSGVIPDETRRLIFPETHWKWLRDGTDDLQAGCFVLEKI